MITATQAARANMVMTRRRREQTLGVQYLSVKLSTWGLSTLPLVMVVSWYTAVNGKPFFSSSSGPSWQTYLTSSFIFIGSPTKLRRRVKPTASITQNCCPKSRAFNKSSHCTWPWIRGRVKHGKYTTRLKKIVQDVRTWALFEYEMNYLALSRRVFPASPHVIHRLTGWLCTDGT